VAFLEPVNIYLQSERAVKYGFLFVGLTFGAFFLFELLKGLRIHPVQYFLVGLALAASGPGIAAVARVVDLV
jgi:inner membrane protein